MKKNISLNEDKKTLVARERAKKWYWDNKERKQEYDKKYHVINSERYTEYRKTNKERIDLYNKIYYIQNIDKEKERCKEWIRNNPLKVKVRYDRTRAWYRGIKSSIKCSRCNEDHPMCLDFHHIDPGVKENTVSNMAAQRNMSGVLREISKCIVLCANCHRKEHARLKEEKLRSANVNNASTA